MTKYGRALQKGYFVAEDGSVIGVRGRPIKSFLINSGYLKISVLDDLTGKVVNLHVHRLAATQKFGEIPEGFQVDHIDGNKLNNSLSNLQLVSPSDNIKNWMGLSGKNRGERANGAKLSWDQVRHIRAALSEGVTGRSLAREYNVDPMTISGIRNNRTWIEHA